MSLPLQAAAAALLALLVLSVLAVQGGTPPDVIVSWYLALRRPWWQPPDWTIPVVWVVIFALMAWAVRRAWRHAPDREARRALLHATILNLFLNGLWAVLFFAWRRPDLALIETVPFWLSIALLIWLCRRQDRRAPWLLAPYLAWVSFAAWLNLALLRLNP
jgi:tryptophan-rich sensory protein